MKSITRSGHFLGALALAASSVAAPALAADEVNLYTTREPQLITPLLESFTQETGIDVNTVFVKDGLIERIKSEGAKCPAAVLMTVDIGKLLDLGEADVTQPIDSDALPQAIRAHLRGEDNNWFTLSLRDRVAYVADAIDVDEITYEELADPKWKGKVCIPSGQHPYNTALQIGRASCREIG